MPAPPKPADSERSKKSKKDKEHPSPVSTPLAESSPSKSAFRDPAPIPEITKKASKPASSTHLNPLTAANPLET